MPHYLDTISPIVREVGRGLRVFGNGWVEPLRVIYDHQLVMFDHTEFVVEAGGERYECAPGSFIVIPPGLWHVTRSVVAQPGSRYWAHFDWRCLEHEVDSPILTYHPAPLQASLVRHAPAGVPDGILHGTMESPREMFDLHTRLRERWRRGSPRRRRACRALLLELLLELLDTRESPPPRVDHDAGVAARAREALDALANAPVTSEASIQNRLSHLGYSYAHQARLFKKHHGITPNAYVQALRMTRARDLLRDTRLPITEIAHRVGFENLHYFSRLFRKHEGVSAREFRGGNG